MTSKLFNTFALLLGLILVAGATQAATRFAPPSNMEGNQHVAGSRVDASHLLRNGTMSAPVSTGARRGSSESMAI